MTEDEAKQRWCPFARVGSSRNGLGSMNREALSSEADADLVERNTRCLASACMAWRWVTLWADEEPDPPPERTGFCGLAGMNQ